MLRFFKILILFSSICVATNCDTDDCDETTNINKRFFGSIVSSLGDKAVGAASSALGSAESFIESSKNKVVNVADTVINAADTVTGKVVDQIIHEIQEPRIDIVPGTDWCGNGNRSRSLEEVGLFRNTDACCREHDTCPNNIKGHSTKYGLENTSSYTRSHCDCDTKFYNCLKNAANPVATKVGLIYFNVVRQKCFKLEHPIKSCKKKSGILLHTCDEYELDYMLPKQYQFFDNPAFISIV